jgi:hypothetical protein
LDNFTLKWLSFLMERLEFAAGLLTGKIKVLEIGSKER